MGMFTDFLTDVACRVEDAVDFVKDNPVKTTAVVATTGAVASSAGIAAATKS